MDLCEESPRSVIGHVGEVFPRKRAAQDNLEEGRRRCDSKVLPVVAAPATHHGQFPIFPGHEEYLKNICSQSPVRPRLAYDLVGLFVTLFQHSRRMEIQWCAHMQAYLSPVIVSDDAIVCLWHK